MHQVCIFICIFRKGFSKVSVLQQCILCGFAEYDAKYGTGLPTVSAYRD